MNSLRRPAEVSTDEDGIGDRIRCAFHDKVNAVVIAADTRMHYAIGLRHPLAIQTGPAKEESMSGIPVRETYRHHAGFVGIANQRIYGIGAENPLLGRRAAVSAILT